MIWVPDRTGRFPRRPHYDSRELDYECQEVITSFLKQRHGAVKFPISIDDITVLIEQNTSDLDLYADLSADGENIEGATDFFKDKKPAVLISKELSEQPWREHRLKTTLTHEYGHVKLHAFLWNFYQPKLIPSPGWERGPRCKRGTILIASKSDWIEWQASYASGAYLMPVTYLRQIAGNFLKDHHLYEFVNVDSPEAEILIRQIAETFDISQEAAKVRLFQQGYLSEIKHSKPLFDI